MINLDISKLVHPRLWNVLAALLPGSFFTVCIAIANPQFVEGIAVRARLDRLSFAVVFFLLSFVVGAAFMEWGHIIMSLLGTLYVRGRPICGKFLRWLMSARGNPPKQFWFAKLEFLNRACMRIMFPEGLGEASAAFHRAGVQVLLRKYGIKPPEFSRQKEWDIWAGVLGTPEPESLKGILFSAVMHATGWAGLAAVHFAPALKHRSYLVLPVFLVTYGLFRGWMTIVWWNHPTSRLLIALRTTLAAIPQPKREDIEQENQFEANAAGV